MNVIPVVFCFDKRIILGASVAIKSLIDCANDDTTYDIRVFHSDLDIENQKNITSLTENTRHKIAFHYINPGMFKNAPKSKGSWTEIVYYRLLIPEIIKEYRKVIYSDVDVLFKGDLSELYNQDLAGYEWAGVRAEKNSPQAVGHKYFEENTHDYIYWSGFMFINCEEMRKTNFIQKCFNVIDKFNSRLKFFDLDAINLASNNIKALPFKYVALQSICETNDLTDSQDYKYLKNVYEDEELLDAKKCPIIKHYAGKPGKPWRMKNPYKDYKEYIDKLPKELKKYTFRDIRKKIFSKV